MAGGACLFYVLACFRVLIPGMCATLANAADTSTVSACCTVSYDDAADTGQTLSKPQPRCAFCALAEAPANALVSFRLTAQATVVAAVVPPHPDRVVMGAPFGPVAPRAPPHFA